MLITRINFQTVNIMYLLPNGHNFLQLYRISSKLGPPVYMGTNPPPVAYRYKISQTAREVYETSLVEIL